MTWSARAVDIDGDRAIAQHADRRPTAQRRGDAAGAGIVVVVAEDRTDAEARPEAAEERKERIQIAERRVGDVAGDADEVGRRLVDPRDEAP